MRHFHDFILSPFGNTLYRLRLTTLINGLQVIAPKFEICREEHKFIPLPIPVWVSKSASEQAEKLKEWSKVKPGIRLEPIIWSEEDKALIAQSSPDGACGNPGHSRLRCSRIPQGIMRATN